MREELHDAAGVTLRVLLPEEPRRALFVHGIVQGEAPAGPGIVRYDRRGHGASTAPEPYVGTTVEEQAEDAAHVLDAIGAPALVAAGEGLGALVALDLARRHPARVRALALGAPVVAQMLPDGGEWLGTVAAEPLPVPADLAALTSWAVTRRELRAIAVPAVIVTGPASSVFEVRAADALAELLPEARRTHDGDLAAAIDAVA